MDYYNDGAKDEIYYGSRGKDDFQYMIKNILKKAKLKEHYLDILISKEAFDKYGNGFTTKDADKINNYEIFENLGDLSANKIIVSYLFKKFPKIDQTEGNQVLARARIKYGAKQTFFTIAESLGFWKFISAPVSDREHKKKKLLEDVFEAFLGVTEYLIDKHFPIGVGYHVVYCILSNILDEHLIVSFRYEDLVDSKTILKELFDYIKAESKKGNMEFSDVKYDDPIEDKIKKLKTVSVYQIINNKKILLGTGTASIKIDAEQKAAYNAIATMRKMGYHRDPPPIYEELHNEYFN
jgi:dsRNA-specific ribonuclease